MKLVLHPRTRQQIQSFLRAPSHGVILAGPEGSGKYFLASHIAKNTSEECITIAAKEGKSGISIEQIRELYSLTRTGSDLAVIIKDAESMGVEAQNAFLKLLEEPPKNTYFILTTAKTELLLATIRSRAQLIDVLPPTVTELTKEAVQNGYTEQDITSLIYTTKQLAGRFFSLLGSDTTTDHEKNVALAKKFYATNTYQRHKICQENNYDKSWASELLSVLAIIVHALLKQENSETSQKRLIAQAGLIETTAQNLLKFPGNPKIHLAKLCEEL